MGRRDFASVTRGLCAHRRTDSRLAGPLGGRWFPGVHRRASRQSSAACRHGSRCGFTRWSVRPRRRRTDPTINRPPHRAIRSVERAWSRPSVLSRTTQVRLEAVYWTLPHRNAREGASKPRLGLIDPAFASAAAAPAYLMENIDVTLTPASAPSVRIDGPSRKLSSPVEPVRWSTGGGRLRPARLRGRDPHRFAAFPTSSTGSALWKAAHRVPGPPSSQGPSFVNLSGELVVSPPDRPNNELLPAITRLADSCSRRRGVRLEIPPRLWLQMSTLASTVTPARNRSTDASGRPMARRNAGGRSRLGARGGRGEGRRLWSCAERDRPRPDTPAFDRSPADPFGLGGRISTGEQWIRGSTS
jgi:hypothetical protein